MNNWYNEEIAAMFSAVLSLKGEEECRRFFEDLCTIKEIQEMAQRLKVASLLQEKLSYSAINKQTGVSTATISRVSRCLEYGSGGYKLVLNRKKETEA